MQQIPLLTRRQIRATRLDDFRSPAAPGAGRPGRPDQLADQLDIRNYDKRSDYPYRDRAQP